MTSRRANLVLGICASLALGSAALAAPALPAPAPATTVPVKVTDVGCTARLLWFINVGREIAKDPKRLEKDRVSMFQTVELLRGALGYFEARIEAMPSANRSSAFGQEVDMVNKMTAEQRAAEITACLNIYTAAEQRVLASLSPPK